MKFVNQDVKYVYQKDGIGGVYDIIMECAKTCYQSEIKGNQDSKEFVDKLIRNGHTAMLEFGTVYLKIPILDLRNNTDLLVWRDTWDDCPWIQYTMDRSFMYVTTNMRYLWERDMWIDSILNYRIEPSKSHEKFPQRRCVRCTTSIGIGRELTRHRVFSFAQESTRFCNYSAGKFGGELTFITPDKEAWGGSTDAYVKQINVLADAENCYIEAIQQGVSPQIARNILPLSTKAEICMCGFDSDWSHFFNLRMHGITGKPHPEMEALAKMIFFKFCTNITI